MSGNGIILKRDLTSTQVCYLLGIHHSTLRNWYDYINQTPANEIPSDCPGLPPYRQEGVNCRRYWRSQDVHQLYAFQQWIPKGRNGKMGRISEKYWKSEYHDRQRKRKGTL